MIGNLVRNAGHAPEARRRNGRSHGGGTRPEPRPPHRRTARAGRGGSHPRGGRPRRPRRPRGTRASSPRTGRTTRSWRSASARSRSSPATPPATRSTPSSPASPATSPPRSTSPPTARTPTPPACSPPSPRSPDGSSSTAGRPASPSPRPSTTAAPTRPPPPPRPRSAPPRSNAGCAPSRTSRSPTPSFRRNSARPTHWPCPAAWTAAARDAGRAPAAWRAKRARAAGRGRGRGGRYPRGHAAGRPAHGAPRRQPSADSHLVEDRPDHRGEGVEVHVRRTHSCRHGLRDQKSHRSRRPSRWTVPGVERPLPRRDLGFPGPPPPRRPARTRSASGRAPGGSPAARRARLGRGHAFAPGMGECGAVFVPVRGGVPRAVRPGSRGPGPDRGTVGHRPPDP